MKCWRLRVGHRLGCMICTLLTGACSALVGNDRSGPIACKRVATTDPCAEIGMVCGPSGFCQSSECMQRDVCDNGVDDDCNGIVDDGSPETCNAEDDDCDGVVDEGLDEDGDGASWCPHADGPVDCDDTNADVHPGRADDPCDGADSDCDSSSADGTNCTGDQVCSPMSCTTEGCTPDDRCQDIDCASVSGLCGDDQYCDRDTDPPTCRPLIEDCRMDAFRCSEPERCNPETGVCVLARPNGSACTYDSECQSNLCFPAEALRIRPEHIEGRRGLCTRSCCNDRDCDDDEICWEPGSGARACVPETILELGANGVPIARTCLSNAECAPQLCGPAQDDAYALTNRTSLTCLDPTTSPVSCSSRFDCPGPSQFCAEDVCQVGFCTSGVECASGLCGDNRCRVPCRTAAECPASPEVGAPSCIYAGLRKGGRIDHFPICYYFGQGAENGAPCTSNSECRDLTCLGPDGTEATEPKRCAATCCSDVHCGDAGQCRPAFIGAWEMHCLELPRFTTGGSSP